MRFLVADDHSLFLDALKALLEQKEKDVSIITIPDIDNVLSFLKTDFDFDLVMLDYKMPKMNGIEALKIIRSEYPQIPVAIISGLATKDDIEKAKMAGASAFFPKTINGDSLIKAIHLVLKGKSFFPEQKDYYNPCANCGGTIMGLVEQPMLSPREKETLCLLAAGMTNKEIARQMDVAPTTIKLYIKNVYSKMRVAGRMQAVLKAKEWGVSDE